MEYENLLQELSFLKFFCIYLVFIVYQILSYK
jgi:hypothetical protein